jgi:hypothetical protein
VRENTGPRVVRVRRSPDWLYVTSSLVEAASFRSNTETPIGFIIDSGESDTFRSSIQVPLKLTGA